VRKMIQVVEPDGRNAWVSNPEEYKCPIGYEVVPGLRGPQTRRVVRVQFNAYRTEAAVGIAQHIHGIETPRDAITHVLILADALQDAGFSDERFLKWMRDNPRAFAVSWMLHAIAFGDGD
jgi:hypothetical protein